MMETTQGESVDATILTERLGAGKTTLGDQLVEGMLEQGDQPYVIANDIGAMVDTDKYSVEDESKAGIPDVCIGCDGQGDLEKTLEENWNTIRDSNHLLVEPTGFADPWESAGNVSELEGVDLRNHLMLLPLDRLESTQAMDGLYRSINSSNAVMYTFTEGNEEKIEQADEYVHSVAPEKPVYTIGETDWQTIQDERSDWDSNLLTSHIDVFSGIGIADFHGEDCGCDHEHEEGHEHNHKDHGHIHQHGEKYSVSVDRNLSEEEFVERIQEAVGSYGVRCKGFTPEGNVFDLVDGEVRIREVDGKGSKPGVTVIEDDNEVYDEIKDALTDVEPEQNQVLAPGADKSSAVSLVEENLSQAKKEDIGRIYDNRGEVPESFEATDGAYKVAQEVNEIWGEQELLGDATAQYIDIRLKGLQNDEVEYDAFTQAVHGAEVLEAGQTAELCEDTYQMTVESFREGLQDFDEQTVQELEDKQDAEDYHQWFTSMAEQAATYTSRREVLETVQHIGQTYESAGMKDRANDWYETAEAIV
jgi:G3E family GTPase